MKMLKIKFKFKTLPKLIIKQTINSFKIFQSFRFSFTQKSQYYNNTIFPHTKFLIRPKILVPHSIVVIIKRTPLTSNERDRRGSFENDAAEDIENPSGFDVEMNKRIEKNNWYEKDSFIPFYDSLSSPESSDLRLF